MGMFGYAGQILKIDLSTESIVKETLTPDIARKFIGGIGMSAKLLYETVKPNIDALSPGNALIASSTPFAGTSLIGTNKTCWASKSPLTGLAQYGASGDFGTALKWAGYDAIVITGKAARPVYITIFDDEVAIKDAGDLWGKKDNYETADELWDRYGDSCSMFTIGPAGEKLAKISIAYTNKQATAGRMGSGAVMGSKNLKAIVAKGTRGFKVAFTKELLAKTEELLERFWQGPNLQRWRDLGTTIAVEEYGQGGQVAWKNFRESYSADKWINRFGVEEFMKVRDISIPCVVCPVSCRVVQTLKEGEYAGLENMQSCNMGAILSYGAKFDLLNYNQVIKSHDTANRLGVDSNDFTCLMEFLMELQEKGSINAKITDGLKLERNLDTVLTWLQKVANREGFGNVIADGYPGLRAALGDKVVKNTFERRGSSLDMDPRGLFGTEAFGSAVGLAGPHNNFSLGPLIVHGRTPEQIRRYCGRIGVTESETESVINVNDFSGFNIARLTRYVERWNTLLELVGICNRPPLARLYSPPLIAEFYHLITGISMKPEDILLASERCFNLLKLFNVAQGIARQDDYLPERLYNEPFYVLGKASWLQDYYNTRELTKDDFEKMLDDYYEERGWDKDGIPTTKTLAELDIEKRA
jgi:aldehyde:ferredoxin oxidoreductase